MSGKVSWRCQGDTGGPAIAGKWTESVYAGDDPYLYPNSEATSDRTIGILDDSVSIIDCAILKMMSNETNDQ